jgi:hypothetical protein
MQLWLIFWSPFMLYAQDRPPTCSQADHQQKKLGHFFTLAPEWYQVKRTRKGGTHQEGDLIGVRFNYDHIRRYKFYWGAQAFYGSGELHGKNAGNDKLHSRLADTQLEANLGYTFAYKNYPCYSFTPFVGAGYFRETNRFHFPSPLEIKLRTTFSYASCGFLSKMMFCTDWTIGFNARFKLLWQTRCRISGDPEHDTLKQQVGDRLHYRLELPIVYAHPLFCHQVRIGIMPFYEHRIYGGRENYPFDFFETKFRIFGLDLQFIYEY